MPKFPSTTALRSFDAVARHSSFVLAAAELCVTHSAISKQIKQLEEDVGETLVDRTTSHVELTHAGELYLRSIRTALNLISTATTEVQAMDLAGPLSISSGPGFSLNWLIPRLADFGKVCPQSSISLTTSYDHDDIYGSQFDVAIRYGEPTWQSRSIIELFKVDIFPVCSPSMIKGDNPLQSPTDLSGQSLLHDEDETMWPRWLAATGITGVDGTRGHHFPGSVDLLAAAEEGIGIAIGDTIICDRSLRRGSLVRPFEETVPAADAYYVILPDVDPLPALTQCFVDWLLAQAADFKAVV
ncbi:MAG: LysR substrate-binding domain-containing protein [Woeseiaceae bacterium]